MAHIRKRGKVWWVYYYDRGVLKGKSLHTGDQREAIRQQKKIEADLESLKHPPATAASMPYLTTGSDGMLVSMAQGLSEQLAALPKNPAIDDFWPKYERWMKRH